MFKRVLICLKYLVQQYTKFDYLLSFFLIVKIKMRWEM